MTILLKNNMVSGGIATYKIVNPQSLSTNVSIREKERKKLIEAIVNDYKIEAFNHYVKIIYPYNHKEKSFICNSYDRYDFEKLKWETKNYLNNKDKIEGMVNIDDKV